MKLTNYVCALCVLSICSCSSRVGQSCGDGEPSCGLGEYCKLPVGDCGGGASGVCEALPDACVEIFQPVCGCDGETYGNECKAAADGVSLASEEACESEPQPCGGIAGLPCGDREYCKFAVGLCEVSDRSGECAVLSDACLAVAKPVCGCDGLTYDNECTAGSAGVAVSHEGQCEQSACCDPAERPGADGSASCIEGFSCCSDGRWECNEGDGQPVCAELGEECDVSRSATPDMDISSSPAGKVDSRR